ncbi:MAG: hypothetical protein SGILL_002164 [Bacillariaceae sp.]
MDIPGSVPATNTKIMPIDVDYTRAEQFGGFLVYSDAEILETVDGKIRKGLVIMKKVDNRHIFDKKDTEWYTAYLRSETEVLIGVPHEAYESLRVPESFKHELSPHLLQVP